MSDLCERYDDLFKQVTATTDSLHLEENAKTVLSKRYLRRDENGDYTETIDQMIFRVAYNVAFGTAPFVSGVQTGRDPVEKDVISFYQLLASRSFFPNSPTFTGAGTPLGQLAACFVLPIKDDMGRDPAGIMSTLRHAALIQQTGGGNGFSFGDLRQKGAYVKSSGGTSSGPVAFMGVYDQAFGTIAQGGTRRGANMAVLPVSHPDIVEFIKCKTSENAITNFNISVGITDKFMEAVNNDRDFDLVAPHTGEVTETVRARELFGLIVKYAHHNGEPGVLFLDAANRQNPVPHLYELKATNPCGEQWLGPYENCCLGSINLAQHLLPDGKMDWTKLESTTRTATRFLDNVVEANAYVSEIPELRQAAMACRRIGLGVMGMADAMYHVGVRYGSERAEDFSGQIMEFIRYTAMLTSIELAKERGAFPEIRGSIYDPDTVLDEWELPVPRVCHGREYEEGLDDSWSKIRYRPKEDFGQPECMWSKVRSRLRKHGIRNACIATIAPTGTIATVAGCEGYGCEPVFALAYFRHVNDNGEDLVLTYVSPLFDKALEEAGITGEKKERIIEKVADTGSCQGVAEVPQHIRDVFVVSADITPKEHVHMQAAMQTFVDNSLSKTCNLPADATEEDVAKCYRLAWELGCKGLTVYVTGSRDKVVLETKEEARRKAADKSSEGPDGERSVDDNNSGKSEVRQRLQKAPRPDELDGKTWSIDTPLGKALVTVNMGRGEPFEVIINVSKAGNETAAIGAAFGRTISTALRVTPLPNRRAMLKMFSEQMIGTGGARSGFGKNRILSMPDAIGKVLRLACTLETSISLSNSMIGLDDICALEYVNGEDEVEVGALELTNNTKPQARSLCRQCGKASVIHSEGCEKCTECDYSACG